MEFKKISKTMKRRKEAEKFTSTITQNRKKKKKTKRNERKITHKTMNEKKIQICKI